MLMFWIKNECDGCARKTPHFGKNELFLLDFDTFTISFQP